MLICHPDTFVFLIIEIPFYYLFRLTFQFSLGKVVPTYKKTKLDGDETLSPLMQKEKKF